MQNLAIISPDSEPVIVPMALINGLEHSKCRQHRDCGSSNDKNSGSGGRHSMETIQQVLERKGNEVHAVSPDVTILDALGVMAQHDIGAVLVMDGDRLLGIFSERDYARKVALKGLVSRDVQVTQLMTADPRTVSPSSTVEEVMNMMTENRLD